MRVWMLIPLVCIVPFLAAAETTPTNCGIFTVYPENEALIFDRHGNIERKVGPGLQVCVPHLETVLIVDTLSERQEEVEINFPSARCEITVSVSWKISDLEIYYIKGQESAAASSIQKLVQEALVSAEDYDLLEAEITGYFHRSLRENNPVLEELGVRYYGASLDFRNCTEV